MKDDFLLIILVIFIIVISWKIYNDSDEFQLKCIISDVDNNKYCVRERKIFKRKWKFNRFKYTDFCCNS